MPDLTLTEQLPGPLRVQAALERGAPDTALPTGTPPLGELLGLHRPHPTDKEPESLLELLLRRLLIPGGGEEDLSSRGTFFSPTPGPDPGPFVPFGKKPPSGRL